MINVIQEDYLSFVQTFKTKYDNGEFSIVWLNKIEVPTSLPNDLSDAFELKINDTAYRLVSTLNFYNHFNFRDGQLVRDATTADITFKISPEDGTVCHIHTYANINGQKIENEDAYENVGNDDHPALAVGNSYLEDYLICDFLVEFKHTLIE
jgi:hypothetical protein